MKTPFLAILVLGAAISTAQAQISQEWVARYASPTPWNDVPYAMTVDSGGHIYVTGTTATSGSNDWTTIKYNPAGAQEWLRTLDGGGSDAAFAITTDTAGNVYVTGSSGGGLYYLTAKYSAAGDQLWVQSFADIGEGDAAADIAVDHDGNVYVTGYTTTFTSLDIATIKYSPNGAELWVRRYDSGNGEDVPAAIACDASGIYVTGRSNYDYTTIKYDFDGVQQWVRTYNGPGNSTDAPTALVLDAAGNLYVTGQSTGSGTNFDYATIKYDAAGAEQWVRRYDGPSTVLSHDYDNAAALAVDVNGNVFVTGNSGDDFATVKYDAAGTELWVRRYGPAATADWATAIAVDASGNAYVSGSSYGNSTTQYDFATLSYDASGTVRWTERYNGPGNFYDTPYAIAVGPSGDVYVSGSSGGSGTGLDYATIKYASATTAVAPGSTPRGVFALRTDPNPFTPVTMIRFTIPPGTDRDHVRLAVYDVRGQEVALLVNEVLAPGTYERELNGSTLATGIYWPRLQAGAFSETRKIIHVR